MLWSRIDLMSATVTERSLLRNEAAWFAKMYKVPLRHNCLSRSTLLQHDKSPDGSTPRLCQN